MTMAKPKTPAQIAKAVKSGNLGKPKTGAKRSGGAHSGGIGGNPF